MSDFFLGGIGTVAVMVKFDGVPYHGATVIGNYYKPNNTPFLVDQPFTEIDSTGIYAHSFNIPVDADEGTYKVHIDATKGLASDNFVDTFTEPDGQASLWIPTGGNWEIQSEVYKQTWQHDLPYFSAAGEFAWQDITYEVDVRGDSGFNYEGLAFRFNNIENSYLFYLRTGSGNVRLAKAPFVTLVQTPNYSLPLSGGTWYRLKVIVIGANIKCYVDDELQIEYDDPSPITAGRIGLWCYWTQCSFDNVEATIPSVAIKSYAVKDFTVIPALSEQESVQTVLDRLGIPTSTLAGDIDKIEAKTLNIPDDPTSKSDLEAVHGAGSWESGIIWEEE